MILQTKTYILRHSSDDGGNIANETHCCKYLKKSIDEGLCYDIQMISGGYVLPTALPDVKVDKTEASLCCNSCKHRISS